MLSQEAPFFLSYPRTDAKSGGRAGSRSSDQLVRGFFVELCGEFAPLVHLQHFSEIGFMGVDGLSGGMNWHPGLTRVRAASSRYYRQRLEPRAFEPRELTNISGEVNMTNNPQGAPISYFFLSCCHSAPLAGSPRENPDYLVDQFFRDLTAAVQDRASRPVGALAGFFDQALPPGSDWKQIITQRLNAAQVFVPLYSVGYLTNSRSGLEFARFLRLKEASGVDPVQRLAAVLWAPLAGAAEPPGLREALDSSGEPDYAENGLRHLLKHKPYRDLYLAVLNRLAARIVEIAESNPVGPVAPSSVPDIASAASGFSPGAPLANFDVEIAAPTAATVPVGSSLGRYGDTALVWRPFPGQELPLAEYARQIIERFDFQATVSEVEITRDRHRPGIIIIDPVLAATETGRAALASLASLPRWVLPLLVAGEPHDPLAGQFASEAGALLMEDQLPTQAARRGARGVDSLDEFVSLVPVLVAEAERQYLRNRSGRVPPSRPVGRPRLGQHEGPDGLLLLHGPSPA